MNRKWVGIVLSVGLAISLAWGLFPDSPAHENLANAQQVEGSSLMVKKLSIAQGLLTSLAVADFESMKEEAQELTQLSLTAQWRAPFSSSYGKYGDDFRDAMAEIQQSADAQNTEGAALGYVQMVFACVNCHDVVRDRQGIALNLEKTLDPGSVLRSFQSSGD